MSKNLSRRCWGAGAVCAVSGIVVLSQYLNWSRQTMYSFFLLAAAALLAIPGAFWFACSDKREKRLSLLFGSVFVLLQLCGERVTGVGTIAAKPAELLWLAAGTAVLAPAAAGAFLLFAGAVGQKRVCTGRFHALSSKTVFWGSALILFLCWLPGLLAFYPGLFTYDISWQYQQFQEWNLNTHHPLIHTLMVGGFCELGWRLFGYPAKGLLMCSLFQMGLMALAMASAVRLLHRHRAPFWVCLLILAADAILPFHTLLVVSTTKDTLFGGAVLYLCVVLLEAVLERDALRRTGWMIRFVLAQTAVGILRNNGFICIAAILFAGILGLFRWRKTAVRLIALALCGLISFTAVNAGLKTLTDAQDGHFREMLSVPLQQMARVYHLTEDEAKPEIARWLPTVELYDPHVADLVKNKFEAEGKELPEVFRLWAEVGLRHPVIYADSFLLTGAGFYHIDSIPTGQFAETSFHEDKGWWMVEDSKWPALRELLVRLYSHNEFMNIPLYSILLSPALWAWLMILCFWTGVCKRNAAAVLPGLPLLALYATILLSPVVMMRYMYPIVAAAPVLLGALLIPQGNPPVQPSLSQKE